jgi:hypothetical protein
MDWPQTSSIPSDAMLASLRQRAAVMPETWDFGDIYQW